MDQILVLSPHTDDGEIGCGGSIARYASEGAHVTYVAFSDCRESLPVGWEKDTLRNECIAATRELGVSDTLIYGYPVRRFGEHRQAILEQLVGLQELHPDIVFCPSLTDIHQDHSVIAREALRAFKHTNIYGYDLPWNQRSFSPSHFVRLDAAHMEAKCEALRHYISQKERPYFRSDFPRSLARVRGTMIGVWYAEAFEVIRSIQ